MSFSVATNTYQPKGPGKGFQICFNLAVKYKIYYLHSAIGYRFKLGESKVSALSSLLEFMIHC